MKAKFILGSLFTFVLVFLMYGKGESALEIPVRVIMSSDNTIYLQALYGLESSLGLEVDVEYLDILKSEYPDLSTYFEQIENSESPFLVTVGSSATKAAFEYTSRIPIVFSMVPSPRSLPLESGRICGVGMDVPVTRYFETLKDIRPEAKKVYSVYSVKEGQYFAEAGNYFDLQNGLLYSTSRVEDREEFGQYLEKILPDADAFLMVNDPIFDRETFNKLSLLAKNNHVILMTGFSTLVELGATFGVSPEYNRIGVLTGQMATRIRKGQSDCSQELVKESDYMSFYLNQDYAKASGIQIPDEIQERARLTRLFNLGIQFLNDDKLKSARLIFEKILDKDPKNGSASNYLSLVVEKETGTKSSELMENAENAMSEGQYAIAANYYRRVLRINPNHKEAKSGLALAISQESDRIRLQGVAMEKQGQPFEAIRRFLEALQILPQNQAAQSDLTRLRRKMAPSMEKEMQEGVDKYTRREYSPAIRIFENVLLIQPSHKEAAEYLRLSRKKKEAVQRLQAKLQSLRK